MPPPHPNLPNRCRGCGYALVGLPGVGRCPECGRLHSPRTVVLVGRRGGWEPYAPAIWAVAVAAVACGQLALCAGLLVGGGLFVTLSAAAGVFAAAQRSPFLSRVEVELTPRGYRQKRGPVRLEPGPWRPAQRVSVTPADPPAPSATRHRLRVMNPPGLGSADLDVEFDATPAQAAALLRRLEAWRDGAG